MQQPKYVMGTGEYKNVVRNPFDKFPYDITIAGSNPASVLPWVKVAVKYDPDGKTMSSGLHHGAFIGEDGFVYTWGDSEAPIFPAMPTKTGVGNAVQVVAFDSGGDAFGAGILVLTATGKVILIGCSESGFRGDGSAGVANEATPFTIPLPEAVTEIAAAVYAYAVGVSGKLYQWGGSIQDAYWAGLASGVGKSGNALNSISVIAISEAVAHVQTGGSYWGMVVTVSGKIYGWAKDAGFLGMMPGSTQGVPANITTILNLPGTLHRLALGSEASFALMENGDIYGWGNNTQAAVGNGHEGTFANFLAPWGVASNSLWVSSPVKINPAGVSFCGLWCGPSATFYAYAEDTNGNLWVWGRNKGFVLWNGQGGDPTTQSQQPNKWDVLAPTKIVGFGPIAPPVVVAPLPVVTPPVAPRTVSTVTLTILGQDIVVPATLIKKVVFNDGSTQ